MSDHYTYATATAGDHTLRLKLGQRWSAGHGSHIDAYAWRVEIETPYGWSCVDMGSWHSPGNPRRAFAIAHNRGYTALVHAVARFTK